MTAKKAAEKKTKTADSATKSAKPRTTRTTDAKAADAKEPNRVEAILSRIQDGFKEAGAALSESGSVMDEKRREIILTLIENAQVNADATFSALRDVMESESLTDSLRIQRDALREGIERNVAQVRDLAALAAQSGRESVQPVAGYLSTLRPKSKVAAGE